MQDHTTLWNRSLFWTPPPRTAIAAAFERARADHPPMVTLTIKAKLRTDWFKRDVLGTAQQRITAMKAEVLESFRYDLERIASGQTDLRLVDAIVAMVALQIGIDGGESWDVEGLHQSLERLRIASTDVVFVNAI